MEETNLLKELLYRANVPLCIVDPATSRFVDANSAACRLFGSAREELLEKQVAGVAPHFADKRVWQNHVIHLKEKGSMTGEYEIRRPDGSQLTVRLALTMVTHRDRQYIIAVTNDISQQKAAKELLLLQSMLLDQIQDRITATDLNGRITYINRAECDMLQCSSEELIGKSVRTFGEDPSRGARQQEIMQQTRDRGAWRGEVVNYTKNGSEVILDCRTQLVYDNGGRPIGMCGISTDITERKRAEQALRESEERFRIVFENARDGFYIVDYNTKKTFMCNKAFCDMLGWSGTEMHSKGLIDIHPPESLPHVFDQFERLARNEIVQANDIPVLKKSGDIFYAEITASKIHFSGRDYVFGCFRDTTERTRIEEQLRHSQKMEAIGTLAGGIAHDFNNILGAIIGYTEMSWQDAPRGSTIRYNLEQVLKSSARARDLIKQILTFSRKDSRERQPLETGPVIKEVCKLLRATIPANIEIRERIDPGSGVVMAQPVQIHQLVMNLCTNAADAMRETGGALNVMLTPVAVTEDMMPRFELAAPGNYVQLTVRDTGKGIAPEHQDKIFDPFFTTKKEARGTGMGLAVVHGIVKNHGGGICIDSAPGKGTAFHILLPKTDYTPTPATGPDPDLPSGTGHILLVDDEQMIVEMCSQMLASLGYTVTAAHGSTVALERFSAAPHAFDLVITDQTMPHMTGHQLTQKLLKIRKNIPIILCTGFSETMDHKKALDSGIKEFILKPYDRATLAVTVRRVLEAHTGRTIQ